VKNESLRFFVYKTGITEALELRLSSQVYLGDDPRPYSRFINKIILLRIVDMENTEFLKIKHKLTQELAQSMIVASDKMNVPLNILIHGLANHGNIPSEEELTR